MRITSFGHSCFLADVDGTKILFDPGTLSSGFEALTGLDAILITHQHPDHCDVARLPALVAANPDAQRWADPATTAQLNAGPANGQWRDAHVGQRFPIGELTVRATGGRHAVIHPELPVIDNIAYLIGTDDRPGMLLHPGDSLYIPFVAVEVLALPAAAPWMKLSESVDYLRGVEPAKAFPVHQGVLSAAGAAIHNARLSEMRKAGTEFTVVGPGESADF
ncbi:MBL fold metallo-hydrolase [Gordonia sp. X0973]|uniref:MBL fold metallo-hydrolase n=1 Tax=Gordonia sp. X0973 TaxID=2742602 RepID=UPI000F528C20|nr:MBL fold metallo-hydrolase [Gordonia sp. X0973]QKT08023.1 MBL fold metallo-hydrolase [Gordonia sp. X0973]